MWINRVTEGNTSKESIKTISSNKESRGNPAAVISNKRSPKDKALVHGRE